ncbi:MAG: hypothetical protein NC205_00770 [Prevotella sp.]|nr:hypothetical protein [Alistipes senegalensis]MCM1357095.1 hypothetical protein [Prevotella sp.]MCM1472583.1 hypothetical protein [Muribaculaceae bacterium]
MHITNYGLYNVKEEYFTMYRNSYFSDNKSENRPYYLSFIDKNNIIWLIPLSNQVSSYQQKIEAEIKKRGECLFYHIGKIYGKERVFLIGNMFPVKENYILKEYTYSNVHYVVANKNLIKEVSKRAKKFLALVSQDKLKPHIDIMAIKQDLLNS